ncbi:hypothetical protein B0T26DRAFT_273103 [Lasiosphaeria miniovina]|uniref:Uncharacterized protein n=1 Tax=Lasiosphaeria miniovina TaxID=1954250 RepID=A0AA40AJG9_9PEZI|nr:uncharacterized protein B0T26DRAFT_273103 [Lasiosphaeria miniovina]KAK0716983.1 hypothetical protein B0T26DRAFT_273103 [Lasiosphaeria miniovina]
MPSLPSFTIHKSFPCVEMHNTVVCMYLSYRVQESIRNFGDRPGQNDGFVWFILGDTEGEGGPGKPAAIMHIAANCKIEMLDRPRTASRNFSHTVEKAAPPSPSLHVGKRPTAVLYPYRTCRPVKTRQTVDWFLAWWSCLEGVAGCCRAPVICLPNNSHPMVSCGCTRRLQSPRAAPESGRLATCSFAFSLCSSWIPWNRDLFGFFSSSLPSGAGRETVGRLLGPTTLIFCFFSRSLHSFNLTLSEHTRTSHDPGQQKICTTLFSILRLQSRSFFSNRTGKGKLATPAKRFSTRRFALTDVHYHHTRLGALIPFTRSVRRCAARKPGAECESTLE